jgi:hypothetical protein
MEQGGWFCARCAKRDATRRALGLVYFRPCFFLNRADKFSGREISTCAASLRLVMLAFMQPLPALMLNWSGIGISCDTKLKMGGILDESLS